MNNRTSKTYCCYRHFKQGKHEPTCTYCLTHTPLGIINPPHASPSAKPLDRPENLIVQAKPFRIENRTHDYNEVQNKDSLPERLKQPRVYVEQMVDKFVRIKPLLPARISGNNEYEQTVKLFKKIGELLSQKTKQCLTSTITQYCLQNHISQSPALYFTKPQFIDYLMKSFKSFSYEEAELFWNISFNELRFHDRISMEAFVYNFDKFYLRIQNFNNMFSEAALRQRLVDLRVLLYDWATSETAIKYNMRQLREQIHDIEQQLKMSQYEQLYYDFHKAVQNCKTIHIRMRALAQILFNLTDNKNLSSDKILSVIKQKLDEKYRKLTTCREVLRQFFETVDYTSDQRFAVTDIIEYCKTQQYDTLAISDVISWIQGLFEFVFYMQPGEASSEAGLSLNTETKRLQCESILQVSAQLVQQYDRYLEAQSDNFVQICKEVKEMIESGLQKMPQLQGPRKIVVQCNYMAEILLRYIRYMELRNYWWVVNTVVAWRDDHSYMRIKQLLKTRPSQQQIKKNMKGMFTLAALQKTQSVDPNTLKSSNLAPKNQLQTAIKQYHNIKKEQLSLKIKPKQIIKPVQNQQEEQNAQINKILSEANKNAQPQCCPDNSNNNKEVSLTFICPHYSKYVLDASHETNASISAVESLQSRLFQLLDLDHTHLY